MLLTKFQLHSLGTNNKIPKGLVTKSQETYTYITFPPKKIVCYSGGDIYLYTRFATQEGNPDSLTLLLDWCKAPFNVSIADCIQLQYMNNFKPIEWAHVRAQLINKAFEKCKELRQFKYRGIKNGKDETNKALFVDVTLGGIIDVWKGKKYNSSETSVANDTECTPAPAEDERIMDVWKGKIENLKITVTIDKEKDEIPAGHLLGQNEWDDYLKYKIEPLLINESITIDIPSSTKNVHVPVCYFISHRTYNSDTHSWELSTEWYHVFMAKLAFIILFEHFILLVQAFLGFLIPDVPDHVTVRLRREEFLQREWFKQREMGDRYNRYGGEDEQDEYEQYDADEAGHPAWDIRSFAQTLPENSALRQMMAQNPQNQSLPSLYSPDNVAVQRRRRPIFVTVLKKLGFC